MAIDMEIADAAVLVKVRECTGARYRNRMIATAQDDFGPSVQALGQIVIDVLVGLCVIPRNDWDIAAVDDLEERQQIDVVLEHVGKILRRGLANAGCPLRG